MTLNLSNIPNGQGFRCDKTTASYFGDAADVAAGTDNGIGWLGFPVAHNPDVPGCALPMRSRITSLLHSPIPMLPHLTPVHVLSHDTGLSVWCFLVDLGPSSGLGAIEGTQGRGIDLTEGALTALGLTKAKGLYAVSYRVIPVNANPLALLTT